MTLKINRRKFITLSGTAAGAIMVRPQLFSKNHHRPIRFGVITDSHYADRDNGGTRFYRGVLHKIRESINTFNKEKVDFVIHLGDFKDEDLKKNPEDTLSYLKTIEAEYAKFDGPRFHCIGNHDVDSITKQQFLNNIENTGIDKEKSFYSFDIQGYHFVVLDANFDNNSKDHFFKEGSDFQDVNIPESQLKWLKKDLRKTKLPTIVFCHQPFFEYHKDEYILHVSNRYAVREILEKSGKVNAVLHGHVHEETFKEINGIHYITQLGMVDHKGLENNSFAIVDFDGATLNLDGYKRTTSKKLTL
jgi:predicted phosphodiesterase